ncbi:MAG: TraM recognition domain-containing protein [Candidatus Shapirobacteria bacterium]
MELIDNFLNRLLSWLVILATVALVAGALALVFYAFFVWWKYRRREKQSLEYLILQIAVPHDNEIKIDAAEQMFASLASIKKGGWFSFLRPQPHLAFEILAKHEDICFYLSVHRKMRDLVEKQIYGAYPDAKLLEVEEPTIFTQNGKVAFAEMQFRSSAYLPLKVYKDLPTDPLSAITAVMAKMGEEEGAVIQILISPADGKWRNKGHAYVSRIKKNESNPEKAKFAVDPKDLEAIENKCSKPGFKTYLRFVVCAPDLEQANAHLGNLKSAFSQFDSHLNSFKSKKTWLKKSFMLDFIYRYQPRWTWRTNSAILNSEELATVFHLPNKQVETPHLRWVYSKRSPAPINIPTGGLLLGRNVFRGVTRPVYLTDSDRRRHIYIIGRTGVGKTELMRDLILQDIRSGKGVCLIDPHDIAEDILNFIPPERAEDVIYFDPSDEERPLGLNLLEAHTEQQKHFVTTGIINLMYKLFDPYKTGIVGPRFEHGVRNAMLTVMSEPGATFIEVVRIMTDSRLVQEYLPKVTDAMVRRYWTDQIAQTSDFHKSEVLDYTVSKFGRFVTNKMMRNIIGQSESSFDFRKVTDEGKILIINLAKGKLGEENSNFLGPILVPKILMAAMSRQDTPEEQRKDFYLYVDEFQNFATPDFAQILSEARKYRLNLCVANQFIGQMEEEVKNAVFGNVGTLISFNIGVTDANFLQHWFAPTFGEDDLINIEKYNAYIKTIVKSEPQPPFSMDLSKDMAELNRQRNPRVSEMIKQLSRLKYGRAREVVEAQITQRARL